MKRILVSLLLILSLLISCSSPGGGGGDDSGTGGSYPEINVKQETSNIASETGFYNFPDTTADGEDGSTSSVITFTIENTGTIDLNISNISIISGDSADFDLIKGADTAVQPSRIITFTICFDPITAGSKSAVVAILSNDSDEGTYTFTITGEGTSIPAPEINVNQNGINLLDDTDTYDFGSIVADGVGGSSTGDVTFTIQNIGTIDLNITRVSITSGDTEDFDLTDNTSSPLNGPTGETSFTIDFDPVTTGNKSATVTIINNDSDESTYNFTIIGNATAAPEPEINVIQGTTAILNGTGTYDFGDIHADGNGNAASSNIIFTIENIGPAALTISDVAITAGDTGDFDLADNTASSVSGPSGTTSFTISFDPLTSGSKSATVTISNNDSDEAAYTFTVTGNGLQPEINVKQGSTDLLDGADTYNFGSVLADGNDGSASSDITFTIENKGAVDLTISDVAITAGNTGDFDLTDNTSSPVSGPSGITTFTIRFDPLTSGSKSATVTISNNDSDEGTYTFIVTGEGTTAPEMNILEDGTSIADGSHSYPVGSITVGESLDTTFTIQNTGNGTLNLTGTPRVSISGSGFSLDTDAPATVSASGSETFIITFNPDSAGSYSCNVSIDSNDSDENPYTFQFYAVADPIVIDDFETGDFTNMPWILEDTSQDRDEISISSWLPHEGTHKAIVEPPHSLQLSIILDHPAEISFAYKSKVFGFFDNGTLVEDLKDTGSWTVTSHTLSAGTHNLKWDNITAGSDSLELDYITIGSTFSPTVKTRIYNDDLYSEKINIEDETGFVKFGTVRSDNQKTAEFTLKNFNDSSLSLTGSPVIEITGDSSFTVVSDPSRSIASGDTATFQIQFAPPINKSGELTATASIANNSAAENPYTFNLTGISRPSDNFETGDFSHLDWTLGGDNQPTIDSTNVYEGNYSAKLGNIGPNESSTMELTIDVERQGNKTFQFRYKLSASGGDRLRLWIDGRVEEVWYGEVDWALYSTTSLWSGTHIIKWEYIKDDPHSGGGDDTAWIDDIQIN